MARLTKDQWESVRAEREAGASFPELAAKWGVSHQAVQKQAKAGKWGDGSDVADVIRRKVAEKVAGVVAGCNPQKKEAALDAAASLVADVVERHRADTAMHRERFGAVPKDFEEGKHAKISMETILLRIKAERASYGLDENTGGETIEIVRSYGGKV